MMMVMVLAQERKLQQLNVHYSFNDIPDCSTNPNELRDI
jgi:hypothetical protein